MYMFKQQHCFNTIFFLIIKYFHLTKLLFFTIFQLTSKALLKFIIYLFNYIKFDVFLRNYSITLFTVFQLTSYE